MSTRKTELSIELPSVEEASMARQTAIMVFAWLLDALYWPIVAFGVSYGIFAGLRMAGVSCQYILQF